MDKLKTTASNNYGTCFETIEDEGGNEYEFSGDNEINRLFIASKTMVNAFTSTDPPLMQIDTSFDVDKARYKIVTFCYLNLTTNKTEIAAIAYTADETADSLGFIFKHFNYLCINRDKMFIVDKDFTQLSSIEKYFPGCTILLGQFHTLTFMRTLLATALETVEKTNELCAMFKRVVYAPSEESYNAVNLNFIEASTGVQTRINQTYRSLQDYYRKNWETCKKMWVKCFRKYLPILGDNTTNRVERTFWSLKQPLKDTFGGLPDTSSNIIHVIHFADNRLKERYNYTAAKSLRIFDNNKTILSLNEAASHTLNDRGARYFIWHKKLGEASD